MRKILLILMSVSLVMTFTACGSSEESQTEETQAEENHAEETHIYDNAEIVTEDPVVMGQEKIFTYSIVEAPSDEITMDVINDWYYNFCVPNDYDWNIILYSDNPEMGIYEDYGLIQVDTYIEQDDRGYYTDSDKNDDVQSTYYWEDDGKLVICKEAGEE